MLAMHALLVSVETLEVGEVDGGVGALVQRRQVETQVDGQEGSVGRDGFEQRGVGKAKPGERVVCGRGPAGDYDFLALLDDEAQPAKEAGSLWIPVLAEQI